MDLDHGRESSSGLFRRQSRHFPPERQRIADIMFVQLPRQAVAAMGRGGFGIRGQRTSPRHY